MGAHLSPQPPLENFFIAGAFSVLDTLLGTQMEVILKHLHLPAAIPAALLDQSGEIAPFLALAKTCETGTLAELQQQLTALGLSAAQCNSAQIEALTFVDKLQFN
jgi:EAL and modified HD-GYP domain-containing signal transduction protein